MLAGHGRADPANADWAALLHRVVRADGVDYAMLRRSHLELDRFLATVASSSPSFSSGSDRKGYLIDVYNACVLSLVVATPGLHSIRDIPSVFSRASCRVAGELLSLDQIEAQVRALGDARCHMALVCASRGCPPLAPLPWRSPSLSVRLDEAVRQFLSPPRVQIDAKSRIIRVSHLFAPEWLGSDFVRQSGSVRSWIAEHAPPVTAAAVRTGYAMEFLDWDWSLNEASSSSHADSP
jgi:hypothetical protein